MLTSFFKQLQMMIYSWELDHERIMPVWLSLPGVKILAEKIRNFRGQNILVIILFSYTSYMADVDLSTIRVLPYKYCICIACLLLSGYWRRNLICCWCTDLNSKFVENYAIIHCPSITHFIPNYAMCNGTYGRVWKFLCSIFMPSTFCSKIKQSVYIDKM
jgi:hypothetical protein